MIDFKFEDPTHRMIAAPTRAGKSYFVGYLVEQLYRKDIPFIVLDTKCENHIGLTELPQVKKVQIKAGVNYNWEALRDYPYIVCVPTLRTRTPDLIEKYRELVDYLFFEPGERIFIVEEAHNWNKNINAADPLLELIAREGAGRQKYLWFISQRLQNFPLILWSQCGYTYLFRHNIPTDIKYISRMVPNFDKINATLEKHDVIVFDHGAIGSNYDIIKAKDVKRLTNHRG